MRIPLLCILEPIKRGVDWLRKHFQQNLRFEHLLHPCTAEWIPRNVSLGPYKLGALTTIINPWAITFSEDWDTNYYLWAHFDLMGTRHAFHTGEDEECFPLIDWLIHCMFFPLTHSLIFSYSSKFTEDDRLYVHAKFTWLYLSKDSYFCMSRTTTTIDIHAKTCFLWIS